MLEIKDLFIEVEGKEIVRGLTLTVPDGKIHALMGPNGSGKSTLCYALAGHPKYKITAGQVIYNGKDLLAMKPEDRAKEGIFLAFQYPVEIPGVNLFHFLFSMARSKANGKPLSPIQFRKQAEAACAELGFNKSLLSRELNVGFSGGEKKRGEMLQLKLATSLTSPSLAILDETDSGLDVDSLKLVGENLKKMRSSNFSALIITHYPRLLQYIVPDMVHVMVDGKIVKTASAELAHEIEKKGYTIVGVEEPAQVSAVA